MKVKIKTMIIIYAYYKDNNTMTGNKENDSREVN